MASSGLLEAGINSRGGITFSFDMLRDFLAFLCQLICDNRSRQDSQWQSQGDFHWLTSWQDQKPADCCWCWLDWHHWCCDIPLSDEGSPCLWLQNPDMDNATVYMLLLTARQITLTPSANIPTTTLKLSTHDLCTYIQCKSCIKYQFLTLLATLL